MDRNFMKLNKNITSLNNHAYQLLGYKVDITPKLKFDSWYSSTNGIIDIDIDNGEFCDELDKNIQYFHTDAIYQHSKANLFSFMNHYKRIFNTVSHDTHKIIIYAQSGLLATADKKFITMCIMDYINDIPVISTMMLISGTKYIIDVITKTNIGIVFEIGQYYLIE